jgi:hypothetical protein
LRAQRCNPRALKAWIASSQCATQLKSLHN